MFYVDSRSSLNKKKDGSDIGGLSPEATSYAASSGVLSKGHEKMSLPGEQSESIVSGKLHGETQSLNSSGQPGSSTPSSSGSALAFSGPGLSPSSSVGSLSSEKSTLNPQAKVWLIRS